jgi:hypothetical protein
VPTIKPATIGENAPPKYPPKLIIALVDATTEVGKTSAASAQDPPEIDEIKQMARVIKATVKMIL